MRIASIPRQSHGVLRFILKFNTRRHNSQFLIYKRSTAYKLSKRRISLPFSAQPMRVYFLPLSRSYGHVSFSFRFDAAAREAMLIASRCNDDDNSPILVVVVVSCGRTCESSTKDLVEKPHYCSPLWDEAYCGLGGEMSAFEIVMMCFCCKVAARIRVKGRWSKNKEGSLVGCFLLFMRILSSV